MWGWTDALPKCGPCAASAFDDVLIDGRRYFERGLGASVAHYVAERPHRGLSLAVPAGNKTPQVRGTTRTAVERGDVLGGLIHEYRWAA